MAVPYELVDYDAMAADAVRGTSYAAAIARVVRPGDVVVEIGTGAGYFAVAACRAGARHVYAIDTNPLAAVTAEVAADNGVANRVTVMVEDVRRVKLPEPADILLADLRAVLPLNGDATHIVRDAHVRLCRPGAPVIARRDVVRAAPCVVPAPIRDWRGRDLAALGVRRDAVERRIRQTWWKAQAGADDLLAAPAIVTELAYPHASSDVDADLTWTIERNGACAGLLLWFDADLADGVQFSTGPAVTATVYGQAFFPIGEPVEVRAGDVIRSTIRHRAVHGESIWAWETDVTRGTARLAADRRTSLDLLAMARGEIDRRRDDFVPAPGDRAGSAHAVLALVDGSRSLGEIARLIRREQPDRFATDADALTFVADTLAALGIG